MLAGRQQRITFDNEHYHADMVFYSRILKAYATIELKTRKLLPAAIGQLTMHLNNSKAEATDSDDNDPIGLILCTDKPAARIEYVLGGLKTVSSLLNTFFIFTIRKHWKKSSKHSSMTGMEKKLGKMADCRSIRYKC